MFGFKKGMLFENEIKLIRDMRKNIEEKSQEELIYYIKEVQSGVGEVDKEKLNKKSRKKLEERRIKIFAVGIEIIKRVLGMDLYDVQISGGLGLTERNIVEMKTGEGKTVTAILSAFWGCVENLQTYVITVNEYLSNRDYLQAKEVFDYLDMEIGHIGKDMFAVEKQLNYSKKVVYITNTEFAFDYLRDNIVYDTCALMQGKYEFIIVDEADLVLIDEARNPVILSSDQVDNSYYYYRAKSLMAVITEDDYEIDDNGIVATLTDSGFEKAKLVFECEITNNLSLYNAVCQSLIAYFVFRKDIDYLVRDNEIMIIDKFTGRVLSGRRFQGGLHQSIEAKENVPVKTENVSIGTITYQNLFKKFRILSGMTGTAFQAKKEFLSLYGVGVVQIPTNRPLIRKDSEDIMFKDKKSKYEYLLNMVKEKHVIGQPILLGTTSVKESEDISTIFDNNQIPYQLLNAKNDKEEDLLVSKAGIKGMITISTNMAGRGTDIKLDEEVEKLGGLCVIGTSRNESKRIDLQLRGRSGRQGQLGESVFLISTDDDLFQRYESSRFEKFIEKTKSFPIEGKKVSSLVDDVQVGIESMFEQVRIQTYKTDEIVNAHRDYIYGIRKDILIGKESYKFCMDAISEITNVSLSEYAEDIYLDVEKYSKYEDYLRIRYGVEPNMGVDEDFSMDNVKYAVNDMFKKELEQISAINDSSISLDINSVMLSTIDKYWSLYLSEVDYMKHSYQLSMIGVQNPENLFTIKLDSVFKEIFYEMIEEVICILLKSKNIGEEETQFVIMNEEDLCLKKQLSIDIESFATGQYVNAVLSFDKMILKDAIIKTKEDILKLVKDYSKIDGFYNVKVFTKHKELISINYRRADTSFIF